MCFLVLILWHVETLYKDFWDFCLTSHTFSFDTMRKNGLKYFLQIIISKGYFDCIEHEGGNDLVTVFLIRYYL